MEMAMICWWLPQLLFANSIFGTLEGNIMMLIMIQRPRSLRFMNNMSFITATETCNSVSTCLDKIEGNSD